ncbi:unnamed protein product [Linum tenue]|uniref:Uncharacterized protein n=1 Tax=Linum tenue TaxID=586396 RepID=A0AAV0KKK5_9ROSI|nr:unnamed protein product [Linum tenue]CAI0430057.1 unnamed protein product [Linum tenue]
MSPNFYSFTFPRRSHKPFHFLPLFLSCSCLLHFQHVLRHPYQRVPSIVDRNEESSGTGDPDDDAIEIRSSLSHWLLFPARFFPADLRLDRSLIIVVGLSYSPAKERLRRCNCRK